MIISIHQPYFIPYISYFQLIHASDQFVIFDDVQFIKGGWVNRNKLLISGNVKYITLPIVNSELETKINEKKISQKFNFERKKILKGVYQSYKKFEFFDEIYPFFEDILFYDANLLVNLLTNSIIKICDFLHINTNIKISSTISKEIKQTSPSDNVIQIVKKLNGKTYVNSIGGVVLYDKKEFQRKGVELFFLKSKVKNMVQEKSSLNESQKLSIIDNLMRYGSIGTTKMLDNYSLI